MSIETTQRFLNTLFDPEDHISLRPIETWTDDNGRKRSRVLYKRTASTLAALCTKEPYLRDHFSVLQAEKANGFFGVCPRTYSGGGKHELAWQIPLVRCLWSDVDDGTPDEALVRIKNAGLPDPSVVVSSGNGGHFYWLLTEPVDTLADSREVREEWTEIKGSRRPIQFIKNGNDKVYLNCPNTGKPIHANRPSLTEVAQRVQDTGQGIASAIGGDHTQDLSRLLRLPGTLNRKNQRNGDTPKPCELVSCDPDKRYPFESFAEFAQKSPERQRREKIANVPLPSVKRLTPTKEDKLSGRIVACDAAPTGTRSETDFALCCFAIEKGIEKNEVWNRCCDVGKFGERGDEYFEATWRKAEGHTREQIFFKSEAPSKVTAKGIQSEQNVFESSDVELTLNEQAVNDAVVEALAERTDLYDFNCRLAEIREVHDEEQGKRIVATPLENSTLREVIAGNVRFFVESEGKDGQPALEYCRTPRWCVDAVASRGQWAGIPILRRVVRCPVLRADGTILQTDGYDQASKLFLDSQVAFDVVPESPTFSQVTSATDDLMDIVGDFPFVDDEHRAAWLASLLTPFARESYTGPTGPLFAFDASGRGSGKGLLASIVSTIVCGRVANVQGVPQDDAEFRKNITAKAMNANAIEVYDNVAGRFGCPSLDAAITTSLWTDRELQKSSILELPLRMTWFATGNNIQFAADMSRRVCHIRLEPQIERPDLKDGFKHKYVLEYVQQNRARFVAASLTILRGFFAAGKPDQKLPAWGSFEGWSSIVRNVVVWAGLPDPGLTRKAVQANDDDTEALREMIRALNLVDPQQKGLRAAQMIRIAQRGDFVIPVEHSEVLRDAIEEFTQAQIDRVGNRLSYRLRGVRKRIVGAHHLDLKKTNGQRLWKVCTEADADLDESAHDAENRAHEGASKTGDAHL